MELPCRARDDQLLKAGELTDIRRRLRALTGRYDLTAVIACAFDHRTRMLPFIYADTHMVPAGVRAIGAALYDAGVTKTRIVLQQWNRNFCPSQMRLDGRVPDMFLISSMQIHTAQCRALIADVCRIDPSRRPLVIAGGPKTIYEPWDVFSADPRAPFGADVAVTGEEYVLLNLLEVLLTAHTKGQTLRTTFIRARDSGVLDAVPGLVYARGDRDGVTEELVDTGIQRLVGDLDELPDPVPGYRLLEPPSRKETLSGRALPSSKVGRYSRIGALVMTFGCKFACPYCPIPAYNQRHYRAKSGERIADEMQGLYNAYGVRHFFAADDNLFSDPERTLQVVEPLARRDVNGTKLRRRFRWGTEATIAGTLQLKDHLKTVRRAGVRAVWLGVEDMTATLINKGQSVEKTIEAFRLLRENGICPMPMMMHHDSQPLISRRGRYGLINQIRLLRKLGAPSMQVLMITPATGSKLYDEAYTTGLVYARAGGRAVEPRMFDGNYVVACKHDKPWRKQFNILIAYAYFYNPIRFLISLVHPVSRLYLADCGMQWLGMWGLGQTIRRTLGWAFRLMRGPIERRTDLPASPIPMRSVDGQAASHALPGTPIPSEQPASTPIPATTE